ncbi:DNA-binding protein RFX5-like isoform X2 [Tachypleus tridentatus]|uniref:DNA-binding protein RFX5-like isoform X2 n=1 Tax=Tachypleus tridentatus TaxID=6853 RepID=UPI003FCF0B44
MNKEITSNSESIKTCIQNSVSENIKKKIERILEDVGQLSDVEKLLLYLQLPIGVQPHIDPLQQKVSRNPVGKKAEVAETLTWITTHLEEDPDVSLPKREVYKEYRVFCEANKIELLCAVDFGKVMKNVLSSVKPCRLAARGNSRYCYSGLKKNL